MDYHFVRLIRLKRLTQLTPLGKVTKPLSPRTVVLPMVLRRSQSYGRAFFANLFRYVCEN